MQVKITRSTVAAKQFVKAGQVYDLPDADARLLLQIGKAELVQDVGPVATEPMNTETVEAVVATEAPKRKGRSRGAK